MSEELVMSKCGVSAGWGEASAGWGRVSAGWDS